MRSHKFAWHRSPQVPFLSELLQPEPSLPPITVVNMLVFNMVVFNISHKMKDKTQIYTHSIPLELVS